MTSTNAGQFLDGTVPALLCSGFSSQFSSRLLLRHASDSNAASVGTWTVGEVAGHLLNECLIHGHDIAGALGRPWPIQRHHALLVVESFVFPLIAALPPTALVNQEKAGSCRARIEVRLRGGGRTLMRLDRGSLTLETGHSRDVDARLRADPAALMPVLIGRQRPAKPLLEGKFIAWGARPWKLARMLTAMNPP